MRAQTGQLYELSDGDKVWLGRIEKVGRDGVEFALVEELPAYQPAADVTLLLAVVKFDAFEWAIEKATELGVSTIVPLAAARSEKALLAAAEKRAEAKAQGYEGEACGECGNFTLVRNGTCLKCNTCGGTTGCS